MTKKGMRCVVTGKVQGVFFRANTQEQAERLGITGWAKNLSDGSVEVLAYGEAEKLQDLFNWLKQGPPRARVDDITYEEILWQDYSSFDKK